MALAGLVVAAILLVPAVFHLLRRVVPSRRAA
jgi:hypothetical protein